MGLWKKIKDALGFSGTIPPANEIRQAVRKAMDRADGDLHKYLFEIKDYARQEVLARSMGEMTKIGFKSDLAGITDEEGQRRGMKQMDAVWQQMLGEVFTEIEAEIS